MRIFKCSKCGCVIPEKKILQNIERMKAEKLISRETERKAKEEIRKEKPYIRCHNPGCKGLLEEIDRESVQRKFEGLKNG